MLQEADYAELRTALKAAKAALDRKDFEGALGHCNDALDLDIHSTPAHLRKAEVFLQMEKYSWSALEYKFVVDNFELSAKDRCAKQRSRAIDSKEPRRPLYAAHTESGKRTCSSAACL